jgi:hypothetical protein
VVIQQFVLLNHISCIRVPRYFDSIVYRYMLWNNTNIENQTSITCTHITNNPFDEITCYVSRRKDTKGVIRIRKSKD